MAERAVSQPIDVPFPGVVLRVHPAAGLVETIFPDGKVCPATREPTPENCAQAAEQGYPADADGCWRSLVEHEALHTICAADLWPDGLSAPLRQEVGDARRYVDRLHEEAVVLGVQMWENGQPVHPALRPYRAHLVKWRQTMHRVREAVGFPGRHFR